MAAEFIGLKKYGFAMMATFISSAKDKRLVYRKSSQNIPRCLSGAQKISPSLAKLTQRNNTQWQSETKKLPAP